jgi:RNA polymerase primary sigma factor
VIPRSYERSTFSCGEVGLGGVKEDGFHEFLRLSSHDLLSQERVVALARKLTAGQRALELLDAGVTDAEQRRRLVKEVRRGREARDELLLHNLRLVLSITGRYKVEGLSPEDLFQEGVLGLMHAIEKFDPDMGWRLSTYATWWIRQSVERAIADKARLIRLPVYVHQRLLRLLRARDALIGKKGRATLDDLVDATGFQPSVVRELLQLTSGTASLDDVVGDGLTTLGELQFDQRAPSPEDLVFGQLTADEVNQLLERLPDRQAEVIRLRFGVDDDKPRTLEEIGSRYGVTRERIRQIEMKAMETLRRLVSPEAGS